MPSLIGFEVKYFRILLPNLRVNVQHIRYYGYGNFIQMLMNDSYEPHKVYIYTTMLQVEN